MFGFATKAENRAYAAGCRKAEKAANVDMSLMRAALDELWAKLGATSQDQALRSIENREIVGDDIRRANESMMRLVSEKSAMIDDLTARCNKFNEQVNEIREARDGAQRRINELVGAQRERAHADFNALSDSKAKVQAALHNSEGECNRLSAELNASKAMGAYYLKQRDELLQAVKHAPVIKDYANAGKHDERVNGPRVSTDEKWANYGTVRASVTVDEFDKELAATRKKLFGVT